MPQVRERVVDGSAAGRGVVWGAWVTIIWEGGEGRDQPVGQPPTAVELGAGAGECYDGALVISIQFDCSLKGFLLAPRFSFLPSHVCDIGKKWMALLAAHLLLDFHVYPLLLSAHTENVDLWEPVLCPPSPPEL